VGVKGGEEPGHVSDMVKRRRKKNNNAKGVSNEQKLESGGDMSNTGQSVLLNEKR